jgi:hypothetical protein
MRLISVIRCPLVRTMWTRTVRLISLTSPYGPSGSWNSEMRVLSDIIEVFMRNQARFREGAIGFRQLTEALCLASL